MTLDVQPLLVRQLLKEQTDIDLQVIGMRKIRKILASNAFKDIVIGGVHGEVVPGAKAQTDEELAAYVVP
jgi:hypothetical protein